MTDTMTIIRKEFRCFAGGSGSFLICVILAVVWSLALLTADGGSLWFVFFSVIVAANFSAPVFISERVNGSLEILLTSGVSRGAVLFGKMLFIIIMTSFVGAACAGLAAVWRLVLPADIFEGGGRQSLYLHDAALYLSAAYLNAAASAYFSVRMANPRFLHFINLFLVAAFVSAYSVIESAADISPAVLYLGFLLAAVIFTLLAKKEFAGERILRPVIF